MEPLQYVLTLSGLVVAAILSWIICAKSPDASIWEFLGLIFGFLLSVASFIFLVSGLVGSVGVKTKKSFPAESQVVQNTLVVNSEGLPVITSSDMFFLDKKLNIVKTEQYNGFGFHINTIYSLEVAK